MTSNDLAELITNLYDIEVTRLKNTTTFVTLAYGSICRPTKKLKSMIHKSWSIPFGITRSFDGVTKRI